MPDVNIGAAPPAAFGRHLPTRWGGVSGRTCLIHDAAPPAAFGPPLPTRAGGVSGRPSLINAAAAPAAFGRHLPINGEELTNKCNIAAPPAASPPPPHAVRRSFRSAANA